jgi:hypothetical protein
LFGTFERLARAVGPLIVAGQFVLEPLRFGELGVSKRRVRVGSHGSLQKFEGAVKARGVATASARCFRGFAERNSRKRRAGPRPENDLEGPVRSQKENPIPKPFSAELGDPVGPLFAGILPPKKQKPYTKNRVQPAYKIETSLTAALGRLPFAFKEKLPSLADRNLGGRSFRATARFLPLHGRGMLRASRGVSPILAVNKPTADIECAVKVIVTSVLDRRGNPYSILGTDGPAVIVEWVNPGKDEVSLGRTHFETIPIVQVRAWINDHVGAVVPDVNYI